MYICDMKKENIFLPFEVKVRRYDRFPLPEHQHSFFELCYIASGRGEFVSEKNRIPFRSGAIFLVQPYTNHTYRLEEMCDIIYIELTDAYINRVLGAMDKELLSLPLPSELTSFVGQADAGRVSMLMECVRSEYLSPSYDTPQIASCWINSILLICARNLKRQFGDVARPAAENDKLMSILQYIELHLDNPELLRAKALSRRFNLAENYIGKFFKARTGECLQQYILKCRIKIVEELLNYTDLRINEIVSRTGFVDESHLTHTFKRTTGVTPLEYRKTMNKTHDG